MKEFIDLKYKEFSSKLIPNIDKDRILGIRMPILRKLSKTMDKDFLNQLPHDYHEQNVIHVLMINQIKDYNQMIEKVIEFIPYLDNWAVVDAFYPKSLTKDNERTLSYIQEWIQSDHEYIVRFGLNLLRIFYLEEGLKLVPTINHPGYYVNMMRAWLMCDGLIKHYDTAIKILQNNELDKWTHNKSIQKAIESYRISDSNKEYLRTLKR